MPSHARRAGTAPGPPEATLCCRCCAFIKLMMECDACAMVTTLRGWRRASGRGRKGPSSGRSATPGLSTRGRPAARPEDPGACLLMPPMMKRGGYVARTLFLRTHAGGERRNGCSRCGRTGGPSARACGSDLTSSRAGCGPRIAAAPSGLMMERCTHAAVTTPRGWACHSDWGAGSASSTTVAGTSRADVLPT
jgi:hypothetical protein